MVGDRTGTAFTQQPGQGESVIVQTPLADNLLGNLALMNAKDKLAQKQADRDGFQKRIDSYRQAYRSSDFKYQAANREISDQTLDELADYYTRTGKDPMVARNWTDPGARELASKFDQLYTDLQAGQTIAADIKTKLGQVVADPTKYDLSGEEMQILEKGLEGDNFRKLLSGEMSVPNLKLRMPTTELVPVVTKIVNTSGLTADQWRSGEGVIEMWKRLTEQPDAMAAVYKTAQNGFESAPQEMKDRIERQAAERGRELGVNWGPEEEYLYELAQGQLPDATPWDWGTFWPEMQKLGFDFAKDLLTRGQAGYEGYNKKGVVNQLMSRLTPKDIAGLESMFPEAKNSEEAVAQFRNFLMQQDWGRSLAPNRTGSERTEIENMQMFDQWERDLYSDDQARKQNAADLMFGGKWNNGAKVSRVIIQGDKLRLHIHANSLSEIGEIQGQAGEKIEDENAVSNVRKDRNFQYIGVVDFNLNDLTLMERQRLYKLSGQKYTPLRDKDELLIDE